jgi:hypothetical protein
MQWTAASISPISRPRSISLVNAPLPPSAARSSAHWSAVVVMPLIVTSNPGTREASKVGDMPGLGDGHRGRAGAEPHPSATGSLPR